MLDHVRNMISDEGSIPATLALFFAKALHSIADADGFVYPIASRFMLQRPILAATDPPLLYELLYSKDDQASMRRSWLFRLLRDGAQGSTDWIMFKRRRVWDLLATLVHSGVPDEDERSLLIEVRRVFARNRDARRRSMRLCTSRLRSFTWSEDHPSSPGCLSIHLEARTRHHAGSRYYVRSSNAVHPIIYCDRSSSSMLSMLCTCSAAARQVRSHASHSFDAHSYASSGRDDLFDATTYRLPRSEARTERSAARDFASSSSATGRASASQHHRRRFH